MLDGRYANNSWLQELPKPFSKITWDNAALVSPALAQRENLENGNYVELTYRGRKLGAPIWIMPGQAENTVTLHLGYGRQRAGRVGTNKGYNAYTLRTADALWQGDGLTIRKLPRQETIRHDPKPFHDRRARHVSFRNTCRIRQATALRRRDGEGPERGRNTLQPGRIQKRRLRLGDGRSTSTPASAATPAPLPVRRKITFPSSASYRSSPDARCTGFASILITPVRLTTLSFIINRSLACIARMRLANSSVPSLRR